MNLQTEIRTLSDVLKEIATFSNQSGLKNNAVSSATVGWHMQHIFLATSKMAEQLTISKASEYRYRPNIKRTVVFTTKKIPRGTGKAPKASVPDSVPNPPILEEQLLQLSESVKELIQLNSDKHFKHYVFGTLNRNHTIKLMGIHARHHLKIIREIMASTRIN